MMAITVPLRPLCLLFSLVIFLATTSDAAESDLLRERGRWRRLPFGAPQGLAAQYDSAGIEFLATGDQPLLGLYHETALTGHFEVQADLPISERAGLALFRYRQGKPDKLNFIGISLEKEDREHQVVRVVGRREGKPLRLDTVTGESPSSGAGRHRGGEQPAGPTAAPTYDESNEHSRNVHVLDGSYSRPFVTTDGRLRILRNQVSGVFHLYYGVTRRRDGREFRGWMELAPVEDWNGEDEEWRVGLVAARSEEAHESRLLCRRLITRRPREVDRDDRTKGFAATQRPFTWSGFEGDAVVISFDDRFQYADRDYKFVFWERANYVPVWRLDEQTMFCYEFVETWDDQGRGCYEPMSDRLSVASRVRVVEDNAVRKLIEWRYELLNPDYLTPSDGEGRQRPEVVERYACYPDGRIIRHIAYFPKLDGRHRKWHELGEFIVIAGNQRQPEDLIDTPALTLNREGGEELSFFPGTARDLSDSERWPAVTATARLRRHADPFTAFSNKPEATATTPGNRIRVDVSWHRPNYRMSHWPVGLEPYQTDDKSMGRGRHQVTHTSLLGIAAVGDTDWKYDYQTDDRGRRYREWAFLLGVGESGEPAGIAEVVNSWLEPGNLDDAASGTVRFDRIDRRTGEIVLETQHPSRATFVWRPRGTLSRPCFRIVGLMRTPGSVMLDGHQLIPGKEYEIHDDGKDTLLWLNSASSNPFEIRLSAKQNSDSAT